MTDVTNINILQQRLERAKAALRQEKKRQRQREDRHILDIVRRSGLRLVDLEILLLTEHVAGGGGGEQE